METPLDGILRQMYTICTLHRCKNMNHLEFNDEFCYFQLNKKHTKDGKLDHHF